MKKIYTVLIIVLAALSAAVLIIGIARQKSKPAEKEPETTTAAETKKDVVIKEVEKVVEVEKLVEVEVEKEITSEIIEDGLRDMGFLITQEYFFTDVISFSSSKQLQIFDQRIDLGFTETNYLASYDGYVEAGIDFTAVRVHKNDTLKVITVTLPASEIHSVVIDPNSFTLISERAGIGNPPSVSDFNDSIATLEQNAREKSVERGMLEKADQNARTVISNFIRSIDNSKDYEIVFAAE